MKFRSSSVVFFILLNGCAPLDKVAGEQGSTAEMCVPDFTPEWQNVQFRELYLEARALFLDGKYQLAGERLAIASEIEIFESPNLAALPLFSTALCQSGAVSQCELKKTEFDTFVRLYRGEIDCESRLEEGAETDAQDSFCGEIFGEVVGGQNYADALSRFANSCHRFRPDMYN